MNFGGNWNTKRAWYGSEVDDWKPILSEFKEMFEMRKHQRNIEFIGKNLQMRSVQTRTRPRLERGNKLGELQRKQQARVTRETLKKKSKPVECRAPPKAQRLRDTMKQARQRQN